MNNEQQQHLMANSTTLPPNDHDVGLEDVVNAIDEEHAHHKNDDAATSAMIGKLVWMNSGACVFEY